MSEIGAQAGRNIQFYSGDSETGVRICARTKTLNFASESINVTQDCDDGKRRLLEEGAEEHIDASIEGILVDSTLISKFMTGSAFLSDYTAVIPGYGSITCDFRLSGIEIGAPHEDAATFSATLESSGEWTFTAEDNGNGNGD